MYVESTKANPEELRGLIDTRLAAERRAILATARLSTLLDALDEVTRKTMGAAARRSPFLAVAAMTQPHAYQIEETYLQFLRSAMERIQKKIADYVNDL